MYQNSQLQQYGAGTVQLIERPTEKLWRGFESLGAAEQPQEQRYPLFQCVQHFRVSKQWYGCQCLRFFKCAQKLMHAIAPDGCTDTVRESALKADPGRKISYRTGDSNLRQYSALAFQSDALPTELFPAPFFRICELADSQNL